MCTTYEKKKCFQTAQDCKANRDNTTLVARIHHHHHNLIIIVIILHGLGHALSCPPEEHAHPSIVSVAVLFSSSVQAAC